MSTTSELTLLAEGMLRPGMPWTMRSIPARRATGRKWPSWCTAQVEAVFQAQGARKLYGHQIEAIRSIRDGHDTVISTGTASGKTLCYTIPLVKLLMEDPGVSVLLIFPTKALAADQLHRLMALGVPAIRAAVYDGDTGYEARKWARRNANVLLTNVDMLHASMLPAHHLFGAFFRGLRLVVIDEAHTLRGVFGSHAALILRRLRRVSAVYGSTPVFVFTSATLGNASEHCERLLGRPVAAVTRDTSPAGQRHYLFIMPSETQVDDGADDGADQRADTRATPSMISVSASSIADAVERGHSTLAFCRSRKAAELVAGAASRVLFDRGRADLAKRVQAYRGGYLPEDRREIEASLRSGVLRAVSSTNALESGIDIGGLDVVLMNGFPGSVTAFMQQSGRSGRGADDSLTVMVAGFDALDRYYSQHPDAILTGRSEEALIDPDNPYVMEPHLRLASAEVPLGPGDEGLFGDDALATAVALTQKGLLRAEGGRYYPSPGNDLATSAVDIRGGAGSAYSVVDRASGAILGTADAGQAMHYLHPGAVYLHRGKRLLIEALDIEARVALAVEFTGDYYTKVREASTIDILEVYSTERIATAAGGIGLQLGRARVTGSFPAFQRYRSGGGGELLSSEPLDLPQTQLVTEAAWLTFEDADLVHPEIHADPHGSLHALEHVLIGLLPMHALCDRRDIGGLSTVMHVGTGRPTIFIHEGAPGGSGLARRAAVVMNSLFHEASELIGTCPCADGCPACVQSPKCGNHNEPLSKAGAMALAQSIRSESDA